MVINSGSQRKHTEVDTTISHYVDEASEAQRYQGTFTGSHSLVPMMESRFESGSPTRPCLHSTARSFHEQLALVKPMTHLPMPKHATELSAPKT